jgi:DNA polymerase sigma
MKEMAEVKQILILKVENIIKSCNSEYTIDVYGSHRTGLCMYWSDIDIVVNPISMVFPVEALSYINDRLEREKSSFNQWITNVNYKKKATVPVVTITCSLAALMKQENLVYPKNPCYESIYEKTISVDITFNNF